MRTIKFAVAFATIAFLGSAVVSPVGADSDKKNPATYTCAELIELSVDYIPAAIYWIDGYTSSGEEVIVVGEEYFAVPVEEIVEVCEKDPSKTAAEVVKAQRQKHKQ